MVPASFPGVTWARREKIVSFRGGKGKGPRKGGTPASGPRKKGGKGSALSSVWKGRKREKKWGPLLKKGRQRRPGVPWVQLLGKKRQGAAYIAKPQERKRELAVTGGRRQEGENQPVRPADAGKKREEKKRT